MAKFIYFFLRLWAMLIARLFVKRLDITGLENVPKDKPILFASIHPNSFFDAILLHVSLKRYVFALARGDAFKNKIAATFMYTVHMIPIFRMSEGKENLSKNDETFNQCLALFKKNQQVLIFSEGICKNQKELLPLKKGTARMAWQAWEAGADVYVVPVGIMYDSFSKFGKIINLNFGPAYKQTDFDLTNQPKFVRNFNERLEPAMKSLISHNFKPYSFIKNPPFYPAMILNFPFILLTRWFVAKKFSKTVFFDSICYGIFYLFTGVYWLLLYLIIGAIFC